MHSGSDALDLLKTKITASNVYLKIWHLKYDKAIAHDHDVDGPTDQAERTIVNPMINNICNYANVNNWTPCKHCQ